MTIEIAQYVYIIGPSRDGPVKIGIAAEPRSRLCNLQIGHPGKLYLFWVYPCTHGKTIEPLIHRILRDRWLSGEWFDVPVEQAVAALWIASNDDGNPTTDEELYPWKQHIGMPTADNAPVSTGSRPASGWSKRRALGRAH